MAQEPNLLCRKCGGERVPYYVVIKGPFAILKVMCPNDHTREAIRLSLEHRDQWIGQVADNIYRCAICGERIPTPSRIVREGRWMVLIMECPTHGLKEAKRYIIDTLYPVIQNLHQNVGGPLPPTFTPPPPSDMYGRVSSPNAPASPPPPPNFGPPPPPPPANAVPPATSGKVAYCNECGAALAPGALFCVNCGKEIEESNL
jgi:hypothetical protein